MTNNEALCRFNEYCEICRNNAATVGVKEEDILCDKCKVKNALDALNENDILYYKLVGVMHFVDKWLDGDELKLDEVQRADLAREKILKALEEHRND